MFTIPSYAQSNDSNKVNVNHEEELIEQRDEYSKVFKIDDQQAPGGYRIFRRVASQPIHALQNGQWVEIQSRYMTDEELYATSELDESSQYGLLRKQAQLNGLSDTFVSSTTLGVPQGGVNPRKPLFIGAYFDPVPSAWYLRSKTYLTFPSINTPVRNAKILVWHYGTTGGETQAKIMKYNENLDELSLVWPGHTVNGDYGYINFPQIPQQNTSYKRTSSDISNLINEQVGLPSIKVALVGSQENNRGAVFCSKEWIAIQCLNKSPMLEYEISLPPVPPVPITPDNQAEYLGNCDMSVTPPTGYCGLGMDIPFKLENIREYDKYANDPSNNTEVNVQISRNNSKYQDTGGYIRVYDKTTITRRIEDGTVTWRGVTRSGAYNSLENIGEPTIDKTFTVDTHTPQTPHLYGLAEFVPLNQDIILSPSSDTQTPDYRISYNLEIAKSPDFANSSIVYSMWQTGNTRFQPVGIVDGEIYYVRAKAKDREANFNGGNISPWSEVRKITVDNTAPEIINLQADFLRISPNNETSVNFFDNTKVSFQIKEKNLSQVAGVVRSRDGNELRRYPIIISPTNIQPSQNNQPSDAYLMNFQWDGKDSNNNPVPDGAYRIRIEAVDLAGNINNSLVESSELFVIVDNTGANIGISSPINGYWTNLDSWLISGAVGGFNQDQKEDRDFDELEIASEDGVWKNITTLVDSASNFKTDVKLKSGKNIYRFRTKDSVKNQIDAVGTPNQVREKEWVINKDVTNPIIKNITPTGLISGAEGVTNATIQIEDPLVNSNTEATSGFGLEGNSVKGFFVSLVQSSISGENMLEIPLIADGRDVSQGLMKEINCIPTQGSNQMNLLCSIQLSNLKPQRKYAVLTRIQDKAGNVSCNKQPESILISFGCDSLEGTNTVPDPNSTNSTTLLDNPIADRIDILNNEFVVDNEALIEIVKPNNGILINKSKLKLELSIEKFSDLIIYDGDKVLYQEPNVGSDSNTNDKCDQIIAETSVCLISVDLNLAAKLGTPSLHYIRAVINDQAGNIAEKQTEITIDLSQVEVSLNPSLKFFSPNGDGKQDGIIFDVGVTNPMNTSDLTDVKSWEFSIENNQGSRVYQVRGSNSVSPQIFFEGKCLSSSACVNGEWLIDGDYKYILRIITTDDYAVPPVQGEIYARSQVTGGVLITNPEDQYLTSRGVINVQGQAPSSTNYSNITIVICIDVISYPNSVQCDDIVETKTNNNGFFSSIVTLPQVDKATRTSFNLSATGKDQYGNLFPSLNTVHIDQDSIDPIQSVSITPAFQGLNSEAEYQDFLSGKLTLDDIRSLKLAARVVQGTHGLEVDYAAYNNVTELPNTDDQTGQQSRFVPSRRIGTLTNRTTIPGDPLNPGSNSNVKYNWLPQRVDELDNPAKCPDISCEWIMNYPIPSEMSGGMYELEFTGYKGELVNSLYSGFVLDGRLTSEPRILRVEKQNQGIWTEARKYEDKSYSNSRSVRIVGVADIGSSINVSANNSVLGTTTTSQTGKWELKVELPDTDGEYSLGVQAKLSEVSSSVSSENTLIVLDRIQPKLAWTLTSTPSGSLNPWVRSGDEVSLEYYSSEPISISEVIKEDGFVSRGIPVDSQLRFRSFLSIDQTKEGVYYPEIYLQDYAGNSVTYTNDMENKALSVFVNPDVDLSVYHTSIDPRSYSNDFRLLIDNTFPKKPEVRSDGWGDSKNGVEADGKLPENDRLLDQYVIRGNSIEISGWSEANQTVEILVRVSDSVPFAPKEKIIGNVFPSKSQCKKDIENDKKTSDGVVTRHKDECLWSYTYQFEDDGRSPIGIPYNWYLFQARSKDRSNNTSAYSSSKVVYHDTDNPDGHVIEKLSAKESTPIVDWETRNKEVDPITRATTITATHRGERQADVLYRITTPRAGTYNMNVIRNGRNDDKQTTWGNRNIGIGSGKRDDSGDDCTTMRSTRRIGICSDGIYEIKMRMVDSAGNEGAWVQERLERDTVDPVKPKVEIDKEGDIFGQRLKLKLNGEVGSTAVITVTSENGFSKEIKEVVPSYGRLEIEDLVGTLSCGKVKYTIKTKLIDRAGNISNQATNTSTSTDCPRCGEIREETSKKGFTSPFKSSAKVTSGYGGRTLKDKDHFHDGIDLVSTNGDNAVYPIMNGIVTVAIFSYNNQGGDESLKDEANYVEIKHEEGYTSRYVHLQFEQNPPIRVGDNVTTDTRIGQMGNTGWSTGPHLHLTLLKNKRSVNPANYLSFTKANIQGEKMIEYCGKNVGGDEEKVIELPIDIDESNSDKERKEKKRGLNYEDIKVNLRLLAGEEEFSNGYKDDRNVWIIAHGYLDSTVPGGNPEERMYKDLDDNNNFVKTANEIKFKNPNDIVMLLDWSDPAFGKEISGSSISDGNRDVCRAATWTKSVSSGVKLKLNSWGLSDGSKLNLVGHSLGSILITEISKQFDKKANSLIALDPPSENLCKFSVQGYYKGVGLLRNRNEYDNGEYRSDYSGNARFVRSFVGKRSLGGNQDFALTADESLWMNYNKRTDKGEEHLYVVQSYVKLLNDQILTDEVLSSKDQSKHDSWQREYTSSGWRKRKIKPYSGHSGQVIVKKPDDIQDLKVFVNNREKIYYKKS